LFWFDEANDAVLLHLYGSASLLLAASRCEGFGLPLIEAARHGLPLLLRDLPVFRETAGASATYFSGDRPEELATAVENWFTTNAAGKTPPSAGIKAVNWSESTQSIMAAIRDDQWYRTWHPRTAN
jgi:glycosyltransferase involved in cell wall biosynthesis